MNRNEMKIGLASEDSMLAPEMRPAVKAPRIKWDNLDPLMDVKLVPLKRADNSNIVTQNAIVLGPGTEYETEVAYTSPDYRLIHNRVARDTALDILTRSGHEFKEQRVAFNGRSYRQRWTFPSIVAEPRRGDFVSLGVDLVNSYDKSTPFGLSFIAMRLQCLNGMVMDFALGGFRFRHFGGNGEWKDELEQAVNQMSNMGKNLDLILPGLNGMTQAPLNLDTFRKMTQEVDPRGTMTHDVLMNLEGDSMWDMYNGYTKSLTEQNTIAADRRNREISRAFFNRFSNKPNIRLGRRGREFWGWV
jgi:hypothetical protein